jgi:hypothetical protein
MNYLCRLILILTMSQVVLCGMRATFFKPNYWLEKPRFDRRNMTTAEVTYTYARATQSFNGDSAKIPLLSYQGPEPLLPSFLNPKVPLSQNKPIAYAACNGKYTSQSAWGTIIQNIRDSFFFEATSSISYDCITDITITPTDHDGWPLLHLSKKIEDYITQLKTKLFSSNNNNQKRTYVGPSYFMFGYTKSFDNFEYVDVIDLSIQTGCVVPVIILDYPQSDFYLFPRQDIFNLGIPLQLNLMCGLYDWLNFGLTASVIGYLQNDLLIPVNTNPYPNKLLIPNCQLTTIKTEPLFAITAFIEGEYLAPHWTWFVGFSYTKQNKTVFCNQEEKISNILNKYPIQQPWQQLALTFSSEIDFSCEEQKIMPRVKFVYVKRISSKNCFDTSLFAGQFGFEVLYNF